MNQMALKSKRLAANEVRIPHPIRGTAMRVTRYSKDQSVILHPDDYGELQKLDELVERACQLKPLAISDAGYKAHIEEDRNQEPIEDPEVLRRLFG